MHQTPIYIARRYLFAKKGSTAVTFITWLAILAMTTAVAVMFIIISVFSGLENLSKELISNLHADLTISSKSGKILGNIKHVEQVIKSTGNVLHYSKIIEEKVLITYGDVSEIAKLRAVDSAYTKINPIDKEVFFGKYPSFYFKNEVVLEYTLDGRLKVPADDDTPVMLYMPKSGENLLQREEDLFEKKPVVITGVFNGKDQLNNYIIAPLELGGDLLNLPRGAAYKVVVKLKNNTLAETTRTELKQKLGGEYVIKTKNEENATFWKMINMEKLIVFLIFSLVIFITSFNLSGAIIILQLDKKQQTKALISLGLSLRKIRFVYFYTGIFIVFLGIITGLSIGTLVSYLQMEFGVFEVGGGGFPFPVEIRTVNYFWVTGLALFFGILVSWIFSKINKEI